MIDLFDEDDYLEWNYDFFRTHRVIPALRSRAIKRPFKLKDLKTASLRNNANFTFDTYAKLLVRMYDSLFIEIPPPIGMLRAPGERTMDDLAKWCHEKAERIEP
jgi:hypothetical protein